MVIVPSRLFSSVRRYERVGEVRWEELYSVISSSSWLRYLLNSYHSSRSDSIRLLLPTLAGGPPTSESVDTLIVMLPVGAYTRLRCALDHKHADLDSLPRLVMFGIHTISHSI